MDISIFRFINDIAGNNVVLDKVMIFFAEYFIFVLALFMIVLWFIPRRRKTNREMLLCAMFAFVFSEILGKFAGIFISHTQPFANLSNVNLLVEHGVNNSFPSDHTILVFSILTVIFFYNKNIRGIIALILALVVSIARIYIGVHYPVDVFIGMLIAISMAVFSYKLLIHSIFFEKVYVFLNKITNFPQINDK